MVGSWCITEARGSSWGQRGSVGGGIGRRWRWPGCFVKGTTRSDERIRTPSCSSVFWAVDSPCALLIAWLAVSEVQAAVWVLDEALAVISELAVVDAAVVVGGDVAVATGGSGCKRRGWRLGCGGVGWSGGWCRHSRGVGGGFEAVEEVVVVVDDVVGVVDGGCAAVVDGDVAVSLAFPWLVVGG